MPATLGDVTKTVFIHDPEAHKLHMGFAVAVGQTVHKGDLVILNANGTVQAAGVAALRITIIGVSIHDGVAGDQVTIAMKAFCAVVAEATADALVAGPVELAAWNAVTVRREYATTADATKFVGWVLNALANNGDEILVVLQG